MTAELAIEAFEFFVSGLDHPECVAFDSRGDLWVGSEGGQVFRVGADRRVAPVASMGGFCAAVAFSPKDELVASMPATGLVRVQPNGEVAPFGGRAVAGVRSMVFESTGSLFATVPGNWGRKNGVLLRIRPNGEPEKVAGPMGYINGLALSADGNQLFMAESDSNTIFRIAIGLDGTLGAPEVYSLGCGRFPSGLALDAEGGLWVTCFASDEIWRIGADGQKTLVAADEWSIRLSSPNCVAFGGPENAEIYVCNLARPNIVRAKSGRKGQPLVNQRLRRAVRPRPAPL